MKIMTKRAGLIAALFVLLHLSGCGQTNASSKPSVILISGDTAGWITPCGCTANQSGGLLRRGTFIHSLESRDNVHYFDVGGAASGTTPYFKLKFETILAGEALMHIAAHNLGGPELAFDPAYLREVSGRTNVHFISANARDAAGMPIADPLTTMTLDGKVVAIIGVVSPRYANALVHIDDPRQSILRVLGTHEKFDSVIVLAYLPDDELQSLAASLPEVDAVIGGPTGQAIAPRQVGPTLIASATNKGKFLIELTESANSNPTWSGQVVQMDASIPDDPAQQRNLDSYLARLIDADFPAAESGVAPPLPPGAPASFRVAGTQSCAKCHVADYHAWEISKHARAGDDLVPRHFQADPSCLQCHTTCFALPGGFISPKRTPQLLGSGCENCHGSSAAHVANPAVKTPFIAIDQCIRCHDEENSPHFDKAAYWPRIQHGKKPKPAQ
jgi:hypothetical protein